MIHLLATVKVADLDAFLAVFTTAGLAARQRHGCVGAKVYHAENPNELTILFQWASREAFEGFRADPEARATMASSGVLGPPSFTELTQVADLAG